MSIKFEELPFWKKDLINMVSLSFFKGNAIFSIELNILMVCKESASVHLLYLLNTYAPSPGHYFRNAKNA